MEAVGIVFPGQGSQRVGMAQDFVRQFAESKGVFAHASEILATDLESLCFSDDPRLNLTEYTQPALLTAEIAIWEAVRAQTGISPLCFGGHSLGEFTALVAAGVMDLKDALPIVRERGRLMQRAVPAGLGAMAAVMQDNLERTFYQEVVKECGAEIVNLNSPAQSVISGHAPAVQRACEALSARYPDMRTVMLNVSAPFHSSLMRSIAEDFRAVLLAHSKEFKLGAAERVVSNVTGEFHRAESLLELLVRQASSCVNWIGNMKSLARVAPVLLEIGPQRVLGKFFSALGASAVSITDLRSFEKFLAQRGGLNAER